MNYQKSHYTSFCNAAHKILQLSGRDRMFLDFLCERMDDSNRITIDKDLFASFMVFVVHITSKAKTFEDHQLKKSLNALLEVELLFRIRKGYFVVSPKHFTK